MNKKYYYFPLLLITILLFKCTQKNQCADEPVIQDLIDSLSHENILFDSCETSHNIWPVGVSSTKIHGYTDRVKNTFYDTLLHLKPLDLDTYYFHDNDFPIWYYHFKFTDNAEMTRFMSFSKYSENYIEHGKEGCSYFLFQGHCFMRFRPFP